VTPYGVATQQRSCLTASHRKVESLDVAVKAIAYIVLPASTFEKIGSLLWNANYYAENIRNN